jgi:5-methylcytosine-specific restriction endonuclease McrA
MTRRRHSTTARAKLFHAKGGICHLCGGLVQAGEAWDISHVIPLAIGGADDETNWDVAHRKCHRAHTATVDAPRIAKTKRQHHQHIGAKAKSARGFPPANPRRPATTPLEKQLPPRRLGQ